MPKLKPATLDARREEILAAAERCFAREGFHQTTIQDVIRESGLSAGGIYGHFRSKDELIAAIADVRHARDERLLAAAATGDGALDSLVQLGRTFVSDMDTAEGDQARRVGVQVWAEALRNTAVRDQVLDGLRMPIATIAKLLKDGQARGEVRSDVAPEAVARVIVAMFHGLVLQRLWGEPSTGEAAAAAFTALLDGLRP